VNEGRKNQRKSLQSTDYGETSQAGTKLGKRRTGVVAIATRAGEPGTPKDADRESWNSQEKKKKWGLEKTQKMGGDFRLVAPV